MKECNNFWGGGGGALECNLTVRCKCLKNFHWLFGKKFAFQHPATELLDYKKFPENNKESNSRLFLNKVS